MGLHLAELRCRYPQSEVDAIHINRLDLAPGVVGLVGVNGAGKSTLLNTLAGARPPESGSVEIDGVDLYGRRRRQVLRRVGLMPQFLRFPREMRVGDAMAYAAWIRGVPSREAHRRIGDLLEQVGLQDRTRVRVGSLSGGMNRRLALAVALVTAPDILLLDEPTTGLDPQQRAMLRELVAGLSPTAITVFSSHVMEDVTRLADRIIVMAEGAVAYHGGLREFVSSRGGPDQSAEFAFLSTVSGLAR